MSSRGRRRGSVTVTRAVSFWDYAGCSEEVLGAWLACTVPDDSEVVVADDLAELATASSVHWRLSALHVAGGRELVAIKPPGTSQTSNVCNTSSLLFGFVDCQTLR